MTGRMKVLIKTTFGEVIVEGESSEEILKVLSNISPNFMMKVSEIVSSRLTPPLNMKMDGIIEFTTEGPVLTTNFKLTHYEAIGLILYASNGKSSTASKINGLLQSSGIKSMVPARLNEMTKRGLVFKPDRGRPEIKLTTQGIRWIEREIVPKFQKVR